MEKILYSADLHGNLLQYRKMLDYAVEREVDIVAFGGDLTPKNPERRTPERQRDFIINELFPLFKEFNKQSDAELLLIMGNDDYKSNHHVFASNQDKIGYRMIDQIPYESKNGYYYIGYSYVPYSPYKWKDWEKRDLISDKGIPDRPGIKEEGFLSIGDDFKPFSIYDNMFEGSIEEDLNQITSGLNKSKLILITHVPPYNTACDLTKKGVHVGSEAVKKFIENEQPLLTLHGHIHETVDESGKFPEIIGATISVSPGNDHIPENPYVVYIEIRGKIKCQRLKL